MKLAKKLLFLVIFLLIISPVVVVFLSYSGATKVDSILKKLPFYSKISMDKIVMQQERIEIPDQYRSNYFLPGRDYSMTVPEGFGISIFASRLGKVRMLAFSDQGDLYASIMDEGKILVLPDLDDNGIADQTVVFAKNLTTPQGIGFYQGWLYVVQQDSLVRLRDDNGDYIADTKEEVITGLPSRGNTMKGLEFGPDGEIYISIAASCEACDETDDNRAAILRFDPDGSNQEVYATGLKFAMGMDFDPNTGSFWVSDMGRSDLSDSEPQDELNILEQGKNYGWPDCYGAQVVDSVYNESAALDICTSTMAPAILFRAHSGPFGVKYVVADKLPNYLRNKLIVALHGSDNSTLPTGCKLVVVDPAKPEAERIQDFVTGWILGTEVRGRPVDVAIDKDEAIYISDDFSGTIFRMVFSNQ